MCLSGSVWFSVYIYRDFNDGFQHFSKMSRSVNNVRTKCVGVCDFCDIYIFFFFETLENDFLPFQICSCENVKFENIGKLLYISENLTLWKYKVWKHWDFTFHFWTFQKCENLKFETLEITYHFENLNGWKI